MLNPAIVIEPKPAAVAPLDFWQRIVNDEQLRDCNNLQKLLAGCEIIAALDGVELLAA